MKAALSFLQEQKQKWSIRFKKLEEVGLGVLDSMKEKLIQEKHRMIEVENQQIEVQGQLEPGAQHPYKQWIINSLNSIRKDLRRLKNAKFYHFQEKFRKVKRDLILCIESIQFQDLVKNAGLKIDRTNQAIAECLDLCNSKFNELKSHAQELNPYEYAEEMKSYLEIEKNAKAIMQEECVKENEEEKELKVNQSEVESWLVRYLQPQASLESQDESQFLYQLQHGTHKLYVFSIKTKNITKVTLNFKIPEGICFCHVENELYTAGGTKSSDVKRITRNGEVTELQNMMTQKRRFPMPYWKKNQEIFTVGGFDDTSQNLAEFHCYSMEKNSWKTLSDLPQAMRGSSATILRNVLYNIGGRESTHSILYYKLTGNTHKWSPLNVKNYNFSKYAFRDATVVSNTIVFFGSLDKNATFLLEQEHNSDKLEVKAEEVGMNYARGVNDTSFATLDNSIYVFETNSYTQVFKFSLSERSWTLYT